MSGSFLYTPLILSLVFLFCPKKKQLEQIRPSLGTYCLIGALVLLQLVPFVYPGDSALTGEGKIFTLNILPAQNECQGYIVTKFRDHTIDDSKRFLTKNLQNPCDPLVYYDMGRMLCHHYKASRDFLDLDIFLYAKQKSDTYNKPLIEVSGFCARNLGYSIFKHNSWILTDKKSGEASAYAHPYYNFLYPKQAYKTAPMTSVYRQNFERNGVNEQEILPTDLTQTWQMKPLNVGIHTASKASPAIDESGIYIGADSSWFYAMDFSGRVRWSFFVSGSPFGIHSTAVLDEERVYFGAYNGTLYCLDKRTGTLIWANQFAGALGGSPLLYEDTVFAGAEFFPVDGIVAKLKRSDGTILWTTSMMGEQSHSSPTLDLKDNLVFGGANNGHFFSYDMSSGATKWATDLGGAMKSTPALGENLLFVSSWGRNLTALEPLTGRKVWQAALEAKARTSPSLVPDIGSVIVADEQGKIYSFEQKTGKLLWSFKTDVRPLISSALVVKDQHHHYVAWLPCEHLTLCALDPKDGRVLARYPIETELTSVPVAWNGDLYLALDKEGDLSNLAIICKSRVHGDSTEIFF